MPYQTLPINRYTTFMRSGSAFKSKAILYLWGEPQERFPPSSLREPEEPLLAIVNFTDESPVPPTVYGPSLTMWYPTAMLASVMAMLREERPCNLLFNADTKVADISTGREPVGEEEGTGG